MKNRAGRGRAREKRKQGEKKADRLTLRGQSLEEGKMGGCLRKTSKRGGKKKKKKKEGLEGKGGPTNRTTNRQAPRIKHV